MKLKSLFLLILTMNLLTVFGQSKKFKPKRKMIQIEFTTDTLYVKVGDILYYSGRKHTSVGIEKRCLIENEEQIELIKKEIFYTNKKNAKEGMPGADNAKIVFTFKVLQPGESRIEIQKVFRGKVEEQKTVVIIAKEKE